ncbi:unnamed protein product [Lactuca virosa]|uniref:COPA/B TPR domain-containing protein n=1 Tax=Lactuca virosa TaxID=75947 RepID=A0AAU9NJT7_9ASTR|nr:unnamed protein product [Lactuca virosa]
MRTRAFDVEYAFRESTSKVKIFNKSFQERRVSGRHFQLSEYMEDLCWQCAQMILYVFMIVAISIDSSFYVLKYDRDVVSAHLDSGRPVDEEALEVATDRDYRFELAIQLGKLDIAKGEGKQKTCWQDCGVFQNI